jgi:hypothetical protein
MKKLLLVLLVAALASFLLVGCIPGITPDPDPDPDPDPTEEVAMTIEDEYAGTGGVTFVACGKDVIVTLPTPVAADYLVYVAVKWWDEGDQDYYYDCDEAGVPNADRTVWTFAGYIGRCASECEAICLIALLKHPCCPGEEIALRVVTVDCKAPDLDLFVKFTDCEDECVEPDPCDPPVPGMFMEWTSRTSDACETIDCCEDTCSLVNGWSLVINPDECEGPCDTASGQGCPVEGAIECGCFPYADSGEINCYEVEFSFEDNVGNARTSTWDICLDTDEVISFERNGTPLTADLEGWYTVYDLMPDCPDFE